MKKFIVCSLVCFLSGFMLAACQRDGGVHAGNESDTYQPRPVPKINEAANHQMKGEVLRVDLAAKMVSIRLENGMVQTFMFDDKTVLTGLEDQKQQTNTTKGGKTSNSVLRNLVGKEGSEVTIDWADQNGSKMATNIEVTQVVTSNNTRHALRRR